MASLGKIHSTYILMIIFHIKTFQKQLKVLQDSSKTTFFHFLWKLCLPKREEKIENSKDCPPSARFPNVTPQTTWENETAISKVLATWRSAVKVASWLGLLPQGPDFKWQGWLNGGINQNPKKSLGLQTNPKKSLDQNLTPQKSHAKFPRHTNFQRNYTARIRREHTQELSRIFRLFWICKKIST